MPITVNTPWGQPAIFPDGTPDDEMQSALDGFAMEQQGRQRFQALPAIAQAAQQAFADVSGYQPYEIPVVPGNSFGLSSQQMQQTQGVIQQTQQMNAGEAIRQRAEREKMMEAEKDRQQQFKLQQQQLKSQMTLADHEFKMDQELEKARAEGNYRKAQIIEQERQRGMTEREGLKNNRPFTLSPGSMRVDPATGETMVNPRAEATRAPKIETSVQEVDGKKIAYTWEDGVLKGAQELGAVTPKTSTQSSAANLSIYKQATENVQEKLKAEGLIDSNGVVIPEAAADVPLMVDREYRRLNEIVGAQPPAAPATGAAGIAEHLRSMQGQGTRVLYDGKPGTRMPDGSIVLD